MPLTQANSARINFDAFAARSGLVSNFAKAYKCVDGPCHQADLYTRWLCERVTVIKGIDRARWVANVTLAYLTNHTVAHNLMQTLICEIDRGLPPISPPPPPPPLAVKNLRRPMPTAAEINRSILYDGLISFEDGKPYKLLRLHLSKRGLTPQAYRDKWGLPINYPMTAPSLSDSLSRKARRSGLGASAGR